MSLADALTMQVGPDEAAGWAADALCYGSDPERWMADKDPDPEALRICLACPVKDACLDEALALGVSYRADAGVWAASTPVQRKALRAGSRDRAGVWGWAAARVAAHDRRVGDELDGWLLGEAGRMAEEMAA